MLHRLDSITLGLTPKKIQNTGGTLLSTSQSYLMVAILSLPFFPLFAVLYFFLDIPVLSHMCWAAFGVGLLSYPIFYFLRSPVLGSHVLTSGAFYILVGGSFYAGGINAPGVLWFSAAQLLTSLMFHDLRGSIWTIGFSVGALLLSFPELFGMPSKNLLDPSSLQLIKMVSVVGSSVVIFIIAKSHIHFQKTALETIENQNQRMKEALEENLGLVRILSHDITNAMVVIEHSARMLDREDQRNDAAKSEKHLQKIERGIKNINEIVSQVREQQALSAGKIKVQLNPVNLKSIVDESYFLLKSKFDDKQIELIFSAENQDESFTNVLAERISCTNVIINNLLTNAIKFSQPGGKIKIHAATSHSESNILLLSVQDSGIGMPKLLLEKIFDPTEKTSRTGTSGERGTGFGMPLVKSYMKLYGGDIQVESRCIDEHPQDSGTTITLSFQKAI